MILSPLSKYFIFRYLALIIGLCCLTLVCSAQQRFRGVILDEHNRPIPGVVIKIPNTRGGTVADSSGNFSMRLPSINGAVKIVISAEGFEDRELTVENFDSVYTIRLVKDVGIIEVDHSDGLHFPLPPPRYSGLDIISPKLLGEPHMLKDVASRLGKTLEKLNYGGSTYYHVTGGFALVTRMEQIDKDGYSIQSDSRWSSENPSLREAFSLKNCIRMLFTERTGYFRVMVFVVTTDKNLIGFPSTLTRENVKDWLSLGMVSLPERVGNMAFTSNHQCIAIIYEFHKPETGQWELDPSEKISGHEHLIRAKVIETLNGLQ